MSLSEVVKRFQEFIEWQTYDIVTIALGATVANICPGEPVFLLLVGPPSTGKTELIRGIGAHPGVFELSKLTPHTFISGYINKGKVVGKDKSLLVRLSNEKKFMLAIKDLTSILTMRAEDRSEIFSQFREIADGYCSQPFGTGEDVRWRGKLGIIGGVTGAIDESFALRQSLGERFLQVRLKISNLDKIMEKAAATSGKEEELRKAFQEAVVSFLSSIGTRDITEIRSTPEVESKLFYLSHLVSLGRTGVSRNPYTKVMLSFPESEGPSRLVKQMITLGRGIAACLGKSEIDESIYQMLRQVGRDTLPSVRERCLRNIWLDELQNSPQQTTTVLSQTLNCSKETIRIWLEDLKEVGLLTKKTQKEGTLWSLSAEGFLLIQQSEIYKESEVQTTSEDFENDYEDYQYSEYEE